MKHVLTSMKHNGIYLPPDDHKGFSIKIQGHAFKLSPKSEQMAVAWIRKRQSTLAPPDKVFMKNFMREFLEQLKVENPSSEILKSFPQEYLARIENFDGIDLCNQKAPIHVEIDFSQVEKFLEDEKRKKLDMSQTAKKQLAQQRKAEREKRKEEDGYGYATVDGQKLEIANWTAEPSCLFAGRGDHPQRGRWKEGPSKGDIILNLSNIQERDEWIKAGWKDAVWEPDKMYVAKWEDWILLNIKCDSFASPAFLRPSFTYEKFKKAEA